MDKIGRGIVAGFIATLVLSAMLDPMAMLARTAGVLSPTLGWVIHFIVGSLIWGAGFALVHDRMHGPSWLRGIYFGIAAWLVVLVAVMPLKRGGYFNFDLGIAAAAAMLVIHLIYGAVLGGIYGSLGEEPRQGRRNNPGPKNNLHPLAR